MICSPGCFGAPFAVHVMQILYQNQGFSFQNKKEEAKFTVKNKSQQWYLIQFLKISETEFLSKPQNIAERGRRE